MVHGALDKDHNMGYKGENGSKNNNRNTIHSEKMIAREAGIKRN